MCQTFSNDQDDRRLFYEATTGLQFHWDFILGANLPTDQLCAIRLGNDEHGSRDDSDANLGNADDARATGADEMNRDMFQWRRRRTQTKTSGRHIRTSCCMERMKIQVAWAPREVLRLFFSNSLSTLIKAYPVCSDVEPLGLNTHCPFIDSCRHEQSIATGPCP